MDMVANKLFLDVATALDHAAHLRLLTRARASGTMGAFLT